MRKSNPEISMAIPVSIPNKYNMKYAVNADSIAPTKESVLLLSSPTIVACDVNLEEGNEAPAAHSKAVTKSLALLKRFFGSFSSALKITFSTAGGIPGHLARSEGGGV